MKIFSKRTTPQIGTLEQLVERQAQLFAKRTETQDALDAALADRQSHLTGGDVADNNVAETLQAGADTAQSALVGLDDAIAALTAQIASAEHVRTAEQRRIRAETDAKELAAVVTTVEKLLPAWIATARDMSQLLGSLNNFRYQVGGVANYLDSVAAQTEVGLRVVLDDLSAAVDAVARCEQTIRIGKPEVAVKTRAPAGADIFTYTTATDGPAYRGEVNRP